MIYYGLEWKSLDTYFQMKELSVAPPTPQAHEIRLYAKDNGSGVSTLCVKNDAGNEICLPTSGTLITGVGVAGRVAFWDGAASLSSDADLTFATDTLTATKIIAPTSVTISTLTQGSVLFAGAAGIISQNNASFFWDDTVPKLYIGIALATHTGADGRLSIEKNSDNCILEINSHASSSNAYIFAHRSRGTHTSPLIVSDGDTVFGLLCKAYGGSSYHDLARIFFQVDGTPGNNDMPGRIVFYTTPDGSTSLAERMRITQAGRVGVGVTTPGVLNGVDFSTIQAHFHQAANNYIAVSSDAVDGFVGLLFNRAGANANNRIWAFDAAPVSANTDTTFNISTYTDAGSASTKFSFGRAGQFGIGTDYGTSGQVLTSGGASAPPTWTTPTTGTVTGTGVNGRVAIWSGASSLTSDQDLTFAGEILTIGTSAVGGNAGLNIVNSLNAWQFVTESVAGHLTITDVDAGARWEWTNDGTFRPVADNAYSLGGSANRINSMQMGGHLRINAGNEAQLNVAPDGTGVHTIQLDAIAGQTSKHIRIRGVGAAEVASIDVLGGFIFNDSGADADCRIEGDTDTNLFFTDASTDRIGIGTATPGNKLDVIGTIKVDGDGTKVFKVPTDNTDPTGGGGAATGRIPIHDAAGNLRYLAYY